MRTKGIRYLPALAVSAGLTIGCQVVDVPIAIFAAGIIASILVLALAIRDVISR